MEVELPGSHSVLQQRLRSESDELLMYAADVQEREKSPIHEAGMDSVWQAGFHDDLESWGYRNFPVITDHFNFLVYGVDLAVRSIRQKNDKEKGRAERLSCYQEQLLPAFVRIMLTYYHDPRIHRRIRYGPAEREYLDIYVAVPKEALEKGAKVPVVIAVMGGAFIIGHRGYNAQLGLRLMEPAFASFACLYKTVMLMGQSAGAHLAKHIADGKDFNDNWSVKDGFDKEKLGPHLSSRGLYPGIMTHMTAGDLPGCSPEASGRPRRRKAVELFGDFIPNGSDMIHRLSILEDKISARQILWLVLPMMLGTGAEKRIAEEKQLCGKGGLVEWGLFIETIEDALWSKKIAEASLSDVSSLSSVVKFWGRLRFPKDYPFRPPSILMALWSSDYHPETWQPAWSVATVLKGLLSFMCDCASAPGDRCKCEVGRLAPSGDMAAEGADVASQQSLSKGQCYDLQLWSMGHCAHGMVEEPEVRIHADEVRLDESVDWRDQAGRLDLLASRLPGATLVWIVRGAKLGVLTQPMPSEVELLMVTRYPLTLLAWLVSWPVFFVLALQGLHLEVLQDPSEGLVLRGWYLPTALEFDQRGFPCAVGGQTAYVGEAKQWTSVFLELTTLQFSTQKRMEKHMEAKLKRQQRQMGEFSRYNQIADPEGHPAGVRFGPGVEMDMINVDSPRTDCGDWSCSADGYGGDGAWDPDDLPLQQRCPSLEIGAMNSSESFGRTRSDREASTKKSTDGSFVSNGSIVSLANLKKNYISEHLQKSKDAAYKRRIRISGVMGFLGIMCAFLACAGVLAHRVGGDSRQDPISSALLRSISSTIVLVGLFAFLLALLPTDRRAVPVGTWIFIVLLAFMGGVSLNSSTRMISSGVPGEEAKGRSTAANVCQSIAIALIGCIYLALACYLIVQVTCRSHLTKRLLSRMWRTAAGVYATVVCITLTEAILEGIYDLWGLAWLLTSATALSLTLAARNRDLRNKIQNCVGAHGESAGFGAAVAALVGRFTVDEVLEQARCSFYTVKADRLKMEHIISSQPTPELKLGQLARRTRLGEADAFISHSWSDDPLAKWNAIQAFRKRFKNQHKVEPKLWIDKYCIDQSDFQNSLACLPIYLASCSKMVVICGESYLTRLWCVVELFVFLEMGGSPENLEVIMLPDPGCIVEQIQNFQPWNLHCSKTNVAEEDLLQSVLEAGSSGFDGIRKLVWERFNPQARHEEQRERYQHEKSAFSHVSDISQREEKREEKTSEVGSFFSI
ncbi:unnamed protein product [Durusdinium trenchii]|uniref:Uncharacterized protein n=2 Tax=Durusdinium trenchii TaxID=1381693 RepID=A0ABP0J8W2_9DINO